MTALIIVALIHLVVGYALVTGLAYEGMRQVLKKVTTVDIKKEEEKKPPPPPPKPKDLPPPPIVAPAPKVNLAPPPVVETVQTPPPAPPPIVLAPPPPAPPSQARSASLKNAKDIARFTQDYYPPDALRAEKQGRVGVRVTVGPDGRVSGCTVVSSSGTSSLDDGACKLITKFGKFNPALDDAGSPTTGSISTGITYRFEG